MECPRTEMFQLLFGGQLTPEQQGPLADHAATCPACHAVVETMLTQQGGPQTAERPMTVGSVVGGRFRIDQLLGAGGMGIVVAATHVELGNRVAIKFMRDDQLGAVAPDRRGREDRDDPRDRVAVERFIREARAVVRLRTDHVCRVFDVARLDTGAPYIVMELLQGVDLGRTIAARPLPATIAVEYVMQAMVALAEAHALGIVHRDLKPANLFVTRRNDGGPLVKVLDFGIAKALDESDSRLTRTRVMLGSPGYISPEQLDSPRDVDARTDIWALGVTLYQLLSGRLPFWGRNQTEIAVKIAAVAPPPLEADPRLAAVVLRCLEKARDDRYADVTALAADLVPFGGPRARRIAAEIARAAKTSTGSQPVIPTPGTLPAVSLQAPTAATGATPSVAVPALPIATTPGVQPAAAAKPVASLVRAKRGSAGAIGAPGAAAAASPGTEITAANSTAMTVAVSRPVEIARLAEGRAGDARAADAMFAAGSGASHPRRARRWQIALAGVIGLVAATTITIAVRGLARRDEPGAAAPGSGVVVAGLPGSNGAPAAPSPAATTGAAATPPAPAGSDPASGSPSAAPSVPHVTAPSPGGAAPPAPRPTAPSPSGTTTPAPHATAPSGGAAPAPHATAPSPSGAAPPAPRAAAPSPSNRPLLPPHLTKPSPGGTASPATPRRASPTAPRPGAPAHPGAAPSHAGAAPAKPAAHPANPLRGAPMPLSSLDAELKQSCDATLAPATAASVKPMTIVACWCQPRDQAHARQAFGLLTSPHDRDAVKRACADQGVALP